MTKHDVEQRLTNGEDPLDLSIEKWEDICETNDVDTAIALDNSSDNCALCHVYLQYPDENDPTNCVGCPVYERTKQQYCDGTPYKSWVEIKWIPVNPKAVKATALAELEFLRSLKGN